MIKHCLNRLNSLYNKNCDFQTIPPNTLNLIASKCREAPPASSYHGLNPSFTHNLSFAHPVNFQLQPNMFIRSSAFPILYPTYVFQASENHLIPFRCLANPSLRVPAVPSSQCIFPPSLVYLLLSHISFYSL